MSLRSIVNKFKLNLVRLKIPVCTRACYNERRQNFGKFRFYLFPDDKSARKSNIWSDQIVFNVC